jgi:hypothetical protein
MWLDGQETYAQSIDDTNYRKPPSEKLFFASYLYMFHFLVTHSVD